METGRGGAGRERGDWERDIYTGGRERDTQTERDTERFRGREKIEKKEKKIKRQRKEEHARTREKKTVEAGGSRGQSPGPSAI